MCYFNNGPVDKILTKKAMMNTNDSLISKTNIASTFNNRRIFTIS